MTQERFMRIFTIDDKAMSVSELEAIMDKVVDIVGEYVNQ